MTGIQLKAAPQAAGITHKASLRTGTKKDLRKARQLLRDIRTNSADTIDDLPQKVDFIFKVFFREEGADGLSSVRRIVENRLDPTHDALFSPTVKAFTYSKDFNALNRFLDVIEAHKPGAPKLIVPRVHAYMHQGAVENARKASWQFLRQGSPNLVRKQLMTLLLQIGDLDRLTALRPAFKRQVPAIERATHLCAADPEGETPVFCINLDRDKERLTRARAMQTGGTVFNRSPGVSGSSLPHNLLAATGLDITVPRIAQVGCHLAHMKAWEAVADTVPEGQFGLVTEDDAVFIHGPGRGLPDALRIGQERGFDLLFINFEPMRHRPFDPLEPQDALSIDDALAQIHPKRVPGWGGESYLLTPAGARQLIDMALAIGIVGPLDWQIALYGVETLDRETLETIGPVGPILGPLSAARARHGHDFVMHSGVLTVPLMQQLDMGYTAHHIEVSRTA